MLQYWLPIAITLYGDESFETDFIAPLARPLASTYSWCTNSDPLSRCLRNIKLLNFIATIGALWPRKSKVADQSPLSNTGAEWLGL